MARKSFFVEALYERLFCEGIRSFMPQCRMETSGDLDLARTGVRVPRAGPIRGRGPLAGPPTFRIEPRHSIGGF